MSWAKLTTEQRDAFTIRYYNGEGVEALAQEIGARPTTLERQLRAHRAAKLRQFGVEKKAKQVVAPKKEEAPETQEVKNPNHVELFNLLRSRPWSIEELADKFDRSNNTVRGWLAEMKDAGYVIEEKENTVAFTGSMRPKVDVKLPNTLADELGQEIIFAAASDPHAGSAFAQPTAFNRFIEIAYEEYGVRHIFNPGDVTTGVGGYRGQEHDLIPASRTFGRKQSAAVTRQQIWLADKYIPKKEGLRYYFIGGNHDYWHIVNSGIDAVGALSKQRDDITYLGYDVADIPLTDRADVRLWHPGGGGSYALSYRLQKAIEQTAFDELSRAITEANNPRMRILLAGHLHTEVKFSIGPMVAAHVGCFEGQTNYLKKKPLYPAIGGAIFKVRLTDGGLIQRVEYTFIPFTEITDDWRNWPVPPLEDSVMEEPSKVEVLFSAK